jgi:hypothetical protein
LALHSSNDLLMLKPEQNLDPETLPKEDLDSDSTENEGVKKARENMPPLSSILNLMDL